MAYRYKKNSIGGYSIHQNSPRSLYSHSQCIDEDFPGEGEPIFAQDSVLGGDDSLSFPGEYHNEYTDRSIWNTCCADCGQWFDDEHMMAGLEDVLRSKSSIRQMSPATKSLRPHLVDFT